MYVDEHAIRYVKVSQKNPESACDSLTHFVEEGLSSSIAPKSDHQKKTLSLFSPFGLYRANQMFYLFILKS